MNQKISASKKTDSISSVTPASSSKAASQPNFFSSQSSLLLLQRSLGNQGMQNLIQAKLKIGAPNDKYEREADSIADQVMRMPDPSVRLKPG